jgi:transposase
MEPENAPGKPVASSTLEEAEPSPSRRNASARPHRWPQDLPVVEQVIDPAEVAAQPEQWRCIGSEISEQLDYEPGRFLRRRLVRRKYVSKSGADAAPVIAPLPPMLQQRSGVAPGLLAQIVVSSTLIICRSTGRSKFTGRRTVSGYRDKIWRFGWNWLRTG